MSEPIRETTESGTAFLLPMCILRDEFHGGERSPVVKFNDFFHPNGKTILNRNAEAISSCFVFTGYHYHDGVEILQIHEGVAKVMVDERTFDAGAGDVIFVNPFQAHAIFLPTSDCDFSRSCISFQPAVLFPASGGDDGLFRDLRNLNFVNFIPKDHPANPAISRHIERIVDLAREGADSWSVAAYGELVLLYYEADRNGLAASGDGASSTYLVDFMVNVGNYIDDHLSEGIRTTEIAGYCQYTPEHFCRLFRKCFGQPFKTYMNGYRIQKAKYYMDSGKYPSLSEIADRVGIPNPSYFGTVFKRYVGVFPSEYQKKKSVAKTKNEE